MCLVLDPMGATVKHVPAVAWCFMQVTGSAVVLFFLFSLQQNDENNLQHMEAFPHCKLFWGGKMWFANSVKWDRHFQMLLLCSNTSLCGRSVLQMFVCLFVFNLPWLQMRRMKKYKKLVSLSPSHCSRQTGRSSSAAAYVWLASS